MTDPKFNLGFYFNSRLAHVFKNMMREAQGLMVEGCWTPERNDLVGNTIRVFSMDAEIDGACYIDGVNINKLSYHSPNLYTFSKNAEEYAAGLAMAVKRLASVFLVLKHVELNWQPGIDTVVFETKKMSATVDDLVYLHSHFIRLARQPFSLPVDEKKLDGLVGTPRNPFAIQAIAACKAEAKRLVDEANHLQHDYEVEHREKLKKLWEDVYAKQCAIEKKIEEYSLS